MSVIMGGVELVLWRVDQVSVRKSKKDGVRVSEGI